MGLASSNAATAAATAVEAAAGTAAEAPPPTVGRSRVIVLKSSSYLQPSSTRNDEIGRNLKSVNFTGSPWNNAYASLVARSIVIDLTKKNNKYCKRSLKAEEARNVPCTSGYPLPDSFSFKEKAKNIAPIARHSVRAPVLSDLHRPKKVTKRCTQRRSPRTSHRSSPRRREFSAYIKNEERKICDIDSLKTRRKTRVKRLLL
ncbi:hypothetical protein V1478_000297, partial [Vespula squamosa]